VAGGERHLHPGTGIIASARGPFRTRESNLNAWSSSDKGKSHAAFLADEEEIAPLEEFERDVGERLRLLGADGATCIINA